jgi:hypothetical protein
MVFELVGVSELLIQSFWDLRAKEDAVIPVIMSALMLLWSRFEVWKGCHVKLPMILN